MQSIQLALENTVRDIHTIHTTSAVHTVSTGKHSKSRIYIPLVQSMQLALENTVRVVYAYIPLVESIQLALENTYVHTTSGVPLENSSKRTWTTLTTVLKDHRTPL